MVISYSVIFNYSCLLVLFIYTHDIINFDGRTNAQDYISGSQTSKGKISEETELIARVNIAPKYVLVSRTTEPIVVLIEKGIIRA